MTVVKVESAQEQGMSAGKKPRFFQQMEALHGPASTASPVAPPATPVEVPGMERPSTVLALAEPPHVGAAAVLATPRTTTCASEEAMQGRFLEAIETRGQDSMIREEAWRRQEILAQERAMDATRNAAMLCFIQKLTGQSIPMPAIAAHPIRFMPLPPLPSSSRTHATPIAYAAAPPPSSQPPASTQPPTMPPASGSGGGGGGALSSSRWHKTEVDALIQLRSNLGMRRKGPLWEEISAGMRRMGYSRSSRWCREKWENMYKCFKKVKDSNKKRPEVSKTCPSYFHRFEALYRDKAPFGSTAGVGGAAAEHANAAPQDRGEVSSGQRETIQMAPIAALPIRFVSLPPASSRTHSTLIPYADAPPPPSSQPPASTLRRLLPRPLTMTPAMTPHDASGPGGAASWSRWSEAEVHALFQLRSNNVDMRRKGSLGWEGISAGMRRVGYNRSSKQCMNKWRNMKYRFNKAKDSNQTFHQLEALYRNKAALGSPAGAGAGGAAAVHANAAPQDRIKTFTVAAPTALQPQTLPPVAKNDGNGHDVGGVSGGTQMPPSNGGNRFAFSDESSMGLRNDLPELPVSSSTTSICRGRSGGVH